MSARPLCLTRCVNNLISNALKYGGDTKIALSEDDGNVIIDILDNGPGIPEEKREQVFEPYYRVETSRNRLYGGTGLGLSIARNMAFLNGGELSINNRPHGGLQARVCLKEHNYSHLSFNTSHVPS